ncbi:MAG TPA: glycosyl hydrolase, partial [Terriglobia bacterium]|nr:glycosyl hydrolase [Terriglobia bacterium]
MRRLFQFLLSVILISAFIPCLQAQQKTPDYLNPSLSIERRVDDLVSRMTLEEKVRQMQHTAPAIPRLGIPAYDWWNEALHGVARS